MKESDYILATNLAKLEAAERRASRVWLSKSNAITNIRFVIDELRLK